jgi:hypothetical protein
MYNHVDLPCPHWIASPLGEQGQWTLKGGDREAQRGREGALRALSTWIILAESVAGLNEQICDLN